MFKADHTKQSTTRLRYAAAIYRRIVFVTAENTVFIPIAPAEDAAAIMFLLKTVHEPVNQTHN